MRILMLSWEYPPKVVGGLGNHVYNLARALVKLGNEVHVITCDESGAKVEEVEYGVHIHRVFPINIESEDFIKWTMHLNFAMLEVGIKLINSTKKFDIIHAHDWLVGYCAKVLKEAYKIPLIATIHATESGRNNGIRSEMQRYINDAEIYLTIESRKIIVCSNYMKLHVSEVLGTELGKIKVIPNGIHNYDNNLQEDLKQFKHKYAEDEEKIVFYIGRHVFEKGIQVLIDAIPKILEAHFNTKFIIAGTGPMTGELKTKVENMNLGERVFFTDFMEEEEKNRIYKLAQVAVFPSLYEPFGIVALEAMAMGCPVVVSDVGGFSEIIQHRTTGMKAIPGSFNSIADNILEVLMDDKLARKLKNNGQTIVKNNYSWDKIGESTAQLYEELIIQTKNELLNNKRDANSN